MLTTGNVHRFVTVGYHMDQTKPSHDRFHFVLETRRITDHGEQQKTVHTLYDPLFPSHDHGKLSVQE